MFQTIDNAIDDIGSTLGTIGGDYNTVSDVLGVAINLLIAVSFSISIISITLSAVMYILSGGNPEKTSKAWKAFLYGVIGGAISLGLIVLKQIVFKLVGLDTSGISEIESSY